jgi:hypothetical protein
MGLSILPLDKKQHDEYQYVLGKMYNVEYELGNEKIMTLSNVLENVDGKYFWFCSKENGLDMIRQDRIVTMTYSRSK